VFKLRWIAEHLDDLMLGPVGEAALDDLRRANQVCLLASDADLLVTEHNPAPV
jgi:hypothetical protein